ncbi:alpha/beta hydrolase [Rhodoligotrophos defluvii]|uniref:alpha/beta hydrolase n=1 Tax=Rhodoligotrophos defluvii TaxID=2561934 RepID=UPI0010C95AC5|nr:alpha/beta hydrolase [Rhodoligotrophos defluvii]
MMQLESGEALERVRKRIAAMLGAWTRETKLAQMREDFDRIMATKRSAQTEDLAIEGMDGVRIRAGEEPTAQVILYFHGGGYQFGSITSHRDLMIRLCHEAGIDVVGFNYRLAPEHRFPAAVDDGLAAYGWLLERGAVPAQTAFAGDSAGGGLAVATMLKARAAGLPLPAAAVLMSPWLDLEASGATYETRAAVDPLSQRNRILLMARAYLGRGGDPRHPLASPIHADLRHLPPFLIHVGDHETVLDDARVFAQRLRKAEVPVELAIWDRMIHQFQLFPELPEAQQSIGEMAAFLQVTTNARR